METVSSETESGFVSVRVAVAVMSCPGIGVSELSIVTCTSLEGAIAVWGKADLAHHEFAKLAIWRI